MALNFPANTSLPYIDPVSQLKYIYNPAIGAWEAAIQPPAVIADAPPALNIPGFLWWDNVSGSLYIWYQDEDSGQWVDATATGSVGLSTAYIGEEPQPDPVLGELWWDSNDGRLYIYYDDGGSKQWIQATTGSNGETVVNYGIKGSAGAVAPANAGLHDLWFNTSDESLYVYVRERGEEFGRWRRGHEALDSITYVNSISPGIGISLAGTALNPSISVDIASFNNRGIVKIADTTEAEQGDSKQVVLTPGVLKGAISSYLPAATYAAPGVSSFATKEDVVAGIDSTKSINPRILKQSIDDLAATSPIGSIIEFAGTIAPAGYLQCDGGPINRTSYAKLFQTIGTTFGIGDGHLTFNVPNLTTGVANIIKCIKF